MGDVRNAKLSAFQITAGELAAIACSDDDEPTQPTIDITRKIEKDDDGCVEAQDTHSSVEDDGKSEFADEQRVNGERKFIEHIQCKCVAQQKAADARGGGDSGKGCEFKNVIDVQFKVTDDPGDCVITTTETPPIPQPTSAPGCCRGFDFKSHGKCSGVTDQGKCERSDKCEWLVTDDADNCVVTTTESPTTIEPGCDSDTSKKFEMCNSKHTPDKCERSSSCHWVSAVCELPSTATTPGCCYGNPDGAYSKRRMDACTGYFTERECLFNVDENGNARCHWEDLIEGYDCQMLCPTTTETPTEPEAEPAKAAAAKSMANISGTVQSAQSDNARNVGGSCDAVNMDPNGIRSLIAENLLTIDFVLDNNATKAPVIKTDDEELMAIHRDIVALLNLSELRDAFEMDKVTKMKRECEDETESSRRSKQ